MDVREKMRNEVKEDRNMERIILVEASVDYTYQIEQFRREVFEYDPG